MFGTVSRAHAPTASRRTRSLLVLTMAAGVIGSACTDGLPTQIPDLEAPSTAGAPAGTPTGLRMNKAESVLSPDDASQLEVSDDYGNPVRASEVTWTSGFTSVATVSSTGVVRGRGAGTAIITARRGNDVAQHHAVVVGGGTAALRVSPWTSVLYPGEGIQLRVSDGAGRSVPASDLTWSTSSSSARISASGWLTAVSAGPAVITVQRGTNVTQHGVIVVGEGGGNDPGDGDASDGRVQRLRGDGQSAPVGERVYYWPTVKVVDAAGRGLPGITVRWNVRTGGGSVTSSSTITNGSGDASVAWTLGSQVGEQLLDVTATGVGSTTFTATGTSSGSTPTDGLTMTPTESVLGRGDRSLLRVRDSNGNEVDPSAVTWSSGLSSVATVSSSGLVEGVAPGTAVIVARSGSDVAHSLAIVVGGSAALRISSHQTTVATGQSSQIEVTDDSGRPVQEADLQWSTSASSVATVSSSGVVTGVSDGFAIITARRNGGVAQHAVIVGAGGGGDQTDPGGSSPPPGGSSGEIRVITPESVLSPGDVSLVRVVDESGDLIDASELSFSSSAPAVATVAASGLVTGVSGGEATVTVRRGDASARHSVVVVGGSGGGGDDGGDTGPVARIDLTPSTSRIDEGQSVQIEATARDASGNRVQANFSWSSDWPGVAQVSSGGRVTGVSEGSTTIRVSAGGVVATHSVTVVGGGADPSPPRGEWNEPDNFVTAVDEHWNSFDDRGWYHHGNNPGRVDIQNGKVVWTYTAGMPGGATPGSPVVLEYRHGPYEYHRDEGVTLSSNFHGHQSGVNKMRYWSGEHPTSPLGFYGAGDGHLTLGINTGNWPMGVKKLRWDSPENQASPSFAQSEITRGVPHDIETLIYVGTPGRADGWIKVWLNGVLVLDFRNLAITRSDELPRITQIHLAPVWGGIGDTVPATQTLSIDRTYVSIRP